MQPACQGQARSTLPQQTTCMRHAELLGAPQMLGPMLLCMASVPEGTCDARQFWSALCAHFSHLRAMGTGLQVPSLATVG